MSSPEDSNPEASNLEGRVAVVSGAARGLGAAFARALADRGATVLAFDVDPAVKELPGSRPAQAMGRIVSAEADVSLRQDVERIAAQAADLSGIDVLVNNAGVWRDTPVDGSWEDAVGDWDYVMDTNFRGVLMLSRACIPHMKHRGDANVFNVSTYYVLPARSDGTNPPNTDLYNASKWALNGFTDAWAGHLAEAGVRVNGLCMGATDTPMLRNLFGGELPDTLRDVVMTPEQIAGLMLAVIDEGPGGRSGENIGAWVGVPVALGPRLPDWERITGFCERVELP